MSKTFQSNWFDGPVVYRKGDKPTTGDGFFGFLIYLSIILFGR